VVSPTRTEEFVAEGDLLTDVGGTLPRKVLSTPGMIHVMEWACTRLIQDEVPGAPATVGFEVCIKHVAAAGEGSSCTVYARLDEVIDERKLRFAVEVREGDRTIGVGTHERRVVERAGFGG
jgi:fluoroacetyl-CoA thioesterase